MMLRPGNYAVMERGREWQQHIRWHGGNRVRM